MSAAIERLEQRVNAVTELVGNLRREISRLEQELTLHPALPPPVPEFAPAPGVATPSSHADDALLREVSRLREERAMVRERIRGLIREIDQVNA